MIFTQYSDECLVIASGSFLLRTENSNARLHIDLKPNYNYTLDIIWTFKVGKPDEDVRVELGKHNDNLMELVITNGNFPFGNGTQKASPIAVFSDGKKLYCHYFFSRPTKENPRMLTYTLYLEKAGE